MGGRTDDHEYRGSHHQTPGTLQGGRTDAQIRDLIERLHTPTMMNTRPLRTEAADALTELLARLVAVEDALREARRYVSDPEYDPPDSWLRDLTAKIDAALAAAADTGQGTNEPCECGRPTSVCKFTCDFCTGGDDEEAGRLADFERHPRDI